MAQLGEKTERPVWGVQDLQAMQSVCSAMHRRHVGLQTATDLTRGRASGIYQHLDEVPE